MFGARFLGRAGRSGEELRWCVWALGRAVGGVARVAVRDSLSGAWSGARAVGGACGWKLEGGGALFFIGWSGVLKCGLRRGLV